MYDVSADAGGNRGNVALTAVDETFVCLLAQHHYLTPQHFLVALYRPGSLTAVRARLKQLADRGYIRALQRRIGGALPGSQSRCYTLTRLGRTVAHGLGEWLPRRYRPSELRQSTDAVDAHLLSLNFALLAARRLCTIHPRLSLGRLIHERQLKGLCTAFTYQGTRVRAIPDGLVEFIEVAGARQFIHPVLTEVELGSHFQVAWRAKVRRLVALVESGTYTRLFGRTAVTIAVFAVPGEQYASALIRYTEAELTALNRQHYAGWFRITGSSPYTFAPEQLFLDARWQAPFTDTRTPVLALEGVGGP